MGKLLRAEMPYEMNGTGGVITEIFKCLIQKF